MDADVNFCYDPRHEIALEVSMHTPHIDPCLAVVPASTACLHKRLVDRIRTETGQEIEKVRCAECGEIIADSTHRRRQDVSAGPL